MKKEKVIIVGNGSSIFEKEYGDKIDSFDLVCRMNRGYFEGRKGYEKNVGNRTDILIVHDGFMTEEYLSDEVFNSLQKTEVLLLMYLSKFVLDNPLLYVSIFFDRVFKDFFLTSSKL